MKCFFDKWMHYLMILITQNNDKNLIKCLDCEKMLSEPVLLYLK